MRTNIVLDEKLVREAMKLANVKTKREAVDLALRRFVHSGKQKRLLNLHGSGGIRRNYDYKQARIQRADTVRTKLGELDLYEKDIAHAVSWARQTKRRSKE